MDTQQLAAAQKVVNLRPSDAKALARFLWREEQLLALFDHLGPPVASNGEAWHEVGWRIGVPGGA